VEGTEREIKRRLVHLVVSKGTGPRGMQGFHVLFQDVYTCVFQGFHVFSMSSSVNPSSVQCVRACLVLFYAAFECMPVAFKVSLPGLFIFCPGFICPVDPFYSRCSCGNQCILVLFTAFRHVFFKSSMCCLICVYYVYIAFKVSERVLFKGSILCSRSCDVKCIHVCVFQPIGHVLFSGSLRCSMCPYGVQDYVFYEASEHVQALHACCSKHSGCVVQGFHVLFKAFGMCCSRFPCVVQSFLACVVQGFHVLFKAS
jgi:hypothetical protein